MPIDWNVFKETTKNYFRSFTAQNEQQAAEFISTQYTTAVLQGGDLLYGNAVIVQPAMTDILASAITDAFTQANNPAMNEMIVPTLFGATISQGLIEFWTSAQLTILIPPPGSVAVVTNVVTVPGVVVPRLEVSFTENEDEFINNLVDFFIQHLQSLQGITMAVVPTTPPAPAPFPWTGYG